MELVPAVEMSCVHEYAEDLHVCGYWVDVDAIAPACERAQPERVSRAEEIVENLRRGGVRPHDRGRDRGVRRRALDRPPPHRPAAGATGDLGPFFEEYLVPGAKAFVPRRWPTADQAGRADPRRRRHRRRRPSLLGCQGPGPGRGADPGARPGTESRPSIPSTRRSDKASTRALTRSLSWPPPGPRTTTARPTRHSPASAPTRPTGSAGRRCRRDPADV